MNLGVILQGHELVIVLSEMSLVGTFTLDNIICMCNITDKNTLIVASYLMLLIFDLIKDNVNFFKGVEWIIILVKAF